MNSEIEKARRQFLDECDFVLRIPACLSLDDSYSRLISNVISLPLYTYYGVKENHGEVEVENRYLKYDSHMGLGEVSLTDVLSLEEDESSESTKKVIRHLIEKQDYYRFFNFQDKTYKRLAQCKFKIWSETPRIKSGPAAMITTGFDIPFFIEFAIILFCFEKNLSFEEFNLLKEKYKELLRKNKIRDDILNLPEGLMKKITEQEKKASKFIREICRTITLMNPFDWGAGCLCSFFGTVHAERHRFSQDEAEEPEMLLVEFPVPKNLPKNAPEYVLENFKKGKIWGIFSPGLSSEIYMQFYADYVEEIFSKKQLRINLEKNIFRASEFALIYWEGHEKGLFGPIFSSFFPHQLKDFELKLMEEEEVDGLFAFKEKAPIKIKYASLSHALRLLGPSEMIWKAIREIKDSGKGWIHYYSGRMGWEANGARFLKPEEYKLPKGGVIIEKPKGEKVAYEEEIDLEDENYLYNLLELEICYANDKARIILRLLDKSGSQKAEEEIEEFGKSERNFAFILRLAVAMMVNEEGNKGWLHKYKDLFIKETKPPRDTELGEFRKFLGNCEIVFLDEIAKSRSLDKGKIKKSLIRTREYGPPASVRLAIPNIIIAKKTIDNLRRFECKIIPPNRFIKLSRETIRRIKGTKEMPELEQIPVIEVVETLIRDGCKAYDKYLVETRQNLPHQKF